VRDTALGQRLSGHSTKTSRQRREAHLKRCTGARSNAFRYDKISPLQPLGSNLRSVGSRFWDDCVRAKYNAGPEQPAAGRMGSGLRSSADGNALFDSGLVQRRAKRPT
jgi:hypothetical protein